MIKKQIYKVSKNGKTMFVGTLRQIRRRFRIQWSNVPLQFLPTEAEKLGFVILPASDDLFLKQVSPDINSKTLEHNKVNTPESETQIFLNFNKSSKSDIAKSNLISANLVQNESSQNFISNLSSYDTQLIHKNNSHIIVNKLQNIAKLKAKLVNFPHKPGVYKFLGEDGEVLYVGKAKDLRARVAQYFGKHDTRAQLPFLISDARDLDFTVVATELESLFLENTLIKQYMPPYNIKLRDDKNFAFIKIDYSSAIPTIGYSRKMDQAKDAKYFGPFSSTKKIRATLDLIRRVFNFCSLSASAKRACFYYFLHRCPGICIGAISRHDYILHLKNIETFLSGKTEHTLKKDLSIAMNQASKKRLFEKAARLRDQIRSLDILSQKQTTVFATPVNWDFLSVYAENLAAAVNLFKVRSGKLADKESFLFDRAKGELTAFDQENILQIFAEKYYSQASDLPQQIFSQLSLPDEEIIKQVLIQRSSKKIALHTPKSGQKQQIIKLGHENAREFLRAWQQTQATDIEKNMAAIKTLQEVLGLKSAPLKIECYDISNTQGTNPVGSMVVFENGMPKKSEYRKFKITVKNSPDDFAMMRETLTRRLKRAMDSSFEDVAEADTHEGLLSETDEASISSAKTSTNNKQGEKNKIWPAPNLIVIDGGKGQLGVAVEVLQNLNLQIPVIGLAKRIEEIFLPHNSVPIILPHSNSALQLLQRLRDEAHRFGITFHRSLRSKQAVKSELDFISGIGPKTKKLLKQKIGTVAKIKQTSLEELTNLIGAHKAKIVFEALK